MPFARRVRFIKMHGAGNDFIIIDTRGQQLERDKLNWEKLANRHMGIGCDQIILLEPGKSADIFMRIINADGSEVDACGNATRCVGWLLMDPSLQDRATIETKAGKLWAQKLGPHEVQVSMGQPRFGWKEIPLSSEVTVENIELPSVELPGRAFALSMGNPHCVIFVEQITDRMVRECGSVVENHPLFPKDTNVEFVLVENEGRLRARVWERGVGETQACGTGACAALVAAHRLGLAGRKADVILPGGVLKVEWLPEDEGGEVLLSGAVEIGFRGEFCTNDYLR